MHWAVGRYPLIQRLLGLVMIPVVYVIVRTTDARLGVLGYLISILTYVLFWSLIRWRQRINDLVSAALIYAYPAAFLTLLALSMVVHKIHVLIFGGGAQSASNMQRQEQYRMALPALLKNPIGHGTNQAGVAMGYGAGDFIAVDSYYISVALDYGVIGLVLYVGMFVIVIASAISAMLHFTRGEERELTMLIPLAACLSAFIMIRGVFSQPDIHPMIFTLLGMAVALVARARSKAAAR
jgi:O-antigen ligase